MTGASKAPRNLPSCFYVSCFTVSVIPSINTPGCSNDIMMSIISFKSSFEINKANPFPALTTSFSLIFLSNLFIALEVKLLTNPGKLSLAKEIATFICTFFPKLPKQEPKDPPYWVVLDIWALLGFISIDILLAKTFFILVVCLVVRNDSCDTSPSSQF